MRISDWSSDVCSSDLARALRLAFGQDQRALVDHRIEGAFDDLLIGDGALFDAGLRAELLDDLGDARAFARRPLLVTIIEARLLLLAPADRKGSVAGKGVSVRVELAVVRIITKKHMNNLFNYTR